MRPNRFLIYCCSMATLAILTYGQSSFAQDCAAKCELAYAACSVAEAKGCEAGGAAAGKAAEALGDKAPIPGVGKLLGRRAQERAEKLCKEKLGPCIKIRETCYEGCGLPVPPVGEETPGQPPDPGAVAPPKPVEMATFRVFSDRPRSIVFINSERMGATPDDVLAPYVTPELPVGKYWVRLVSIDSKWEWEGARDIEAGNLNSVDGKLVYLPQRDLKHARSLEQSEKHFEARDAYVAFITQWPDDKKHVSFAEERIDVLEEVIAQLEQQQFDMIVAEQDPRTRVKHCEAYLWQYREGYRGAKVTEIAESAKKTIAAHEQEEQMFSNASSASSLPMQRQQLLAYLQTYPSGRFSSQARERIADIDDQFEKTVFNDARSATDPEESHYLLIKYLNKYPSGTFADEAKKRILEIDAAYEDKHYSNILSASAKATREWQLRQVLTMCEVFESDFPNGSNATAVKSLAAETKQKLDEVLEQKRRDSIGRPQRGMGIALMTVGSGVGIAGLIVGGRANSDRKAMEDGCRNSAGEIILCDESSVANTKEDIKSTALAADVMIWTGLASVVGGIVLYVLAPSWGKQESTIARRRVLLNAGPLEDGAGGALLLQGEF